MYVSLLILLGLDFLGLVFLIVQSVLLSRSTLRLENFLNALCEVLRRNAMSQESHAIQSMEILEKVRDIRREILGIEGNSKEIKGNAVSKHRSKSSKPL